MMRAALASMTVLFAGAAFAVPSTLPDALLYKGKPVAPFCVAELTGLVNAQHKKPLLEMADCKAPKKIVAMGEDKDMKGLIQRVSDVEYGQMTRDSFAFYQYAGEIDGAQVLRVNVNTGGSGDFSTVLLLKREGNTLHVVRSTPIGDRCNGGAVDVEVKNDAVIVTRNVTPGDFLELSGVNPKKLEPYKALEASASSCFATARYDGKTLLSVVPSQEKAEYLRDAKKEDANWSEAKYQPCFNKLFVEEVKDSTVWTPDELKAFMEKFTDDCVEES